MEPEWSEVRKDIEAVLKRHDVGDGCCITDGLLASTLTEVLINMHTSVKLARLRERERIEDGDDGTEAVPGRSRD